MGNFVTAAATFALTVVPISVTHRESRSPKGRQPATPVDGARAVPAGGGSSPLLPGGFGKTPGRHDDRSATQSLDWDRGRRITPADNYVPYVDGPLLARVGSVRIEAIALICPVCCRGHTWPLPRWVPQREFQTGRRHEATTGTPGVSRVLGSIDHTICSVFSKLRPSARGALRDRAERQIANLMMGHFFVDHV